MEKHLGGLPETIPDPLGGTGDHAIENLGLFGAEGFDALLGNRPDLDFVEGESGHAVRELVDKKAFSNHGSFGEAGDRDMATGQSPLEIDVSFQNNSEPLSGRRFVEEIVSLLEGLFLSQRDELFELLEGDIHIARYAFDQFSRDFHRKGYALG